MASVRRNTSRSVEHQVLIASADHTAQREIANVIRKERVFAGLIAAAVLACALSSTRSEAQEYWTTKANRVKIAGALTNWADFCTSTFYFNRKDKVAANILEPKIYSHLLLSTTPSSEVTRWAEWLPYADPGSEVAKSSIERGSDALLAARADPSAANAAEKLYTDTMRDYFKVVFEKCRDGSRDPFIAEIFYDGGGNFERAMSDNELNFAESVKELARPVPPTRKPKR